MISVQAETVRVQTEQITVDMDAIEARLRELEQQADEDEQLITQVDWGYADHAGNSAPRAGIPKVRII